MNLALVSATWFQPEWSRCVASWNHPILVVPHRNILDAYQWAYENCHADILGYVHDDLICEEMDWRERVLAEFENPAVGVVGFAGAPGFCHPSMKTFDPHAMGRIGFRSNLEDAEVHGRRDAGTSNAVVLDGLALFIRRAALDAIGGWPLGRGVGYFMYAEWLCCATRRAGYGIRVVGVRVNHLGGRSTGLNPNLKVDWEEEHKALWNEFSPGHIIPAEVVP